MIERRIIIGLITSTEYIKKIKPVWDTMLLESQTAKTLANWCLKHFEKYDKAPNKEIELIFFKRATKLDKVIAEEIEEEILPELSEQYIEEGIDVDYLVQESLIYLKTRQLQLHEQQITSIIENSNEEDENKLKEIDLLQKEFKPISLEMNEGLDFSNNEQLEKAVTEAFTQTGKPLVYFPKQLGRFWNHQFVPGGFISFLAPEKRGKTYLLLEIALRAIKQGVDVAFFQAGDMNQNEQIKRISTYITKTSYLEKYCKEHFEPVRDCIRNLTNECDKKERQCDFSPLEENTIKKIDKITQKELIACFDEEYSPCWNCKDYDELKLGTTYIKKVPESACLTQENALKSIQTFLKKAKGKFKLSTHANGTLGIKKIIDILNIWQNKDGFVPKIILIDYADILLCDVKTEFRHQQNQIWKDLRKLSQTPRQDILPLVIAPTQADAQSYSSFRLGLSNFSEDKRKYAHVTAMYGLNQDPNGREKGLGLLRINEIIIREGEWSNNNEVTILQNLRRGRPVIGSFFGS